MKVSGLITGEKKYWKLSTEKSDTGMQSFELSHKAGQDWVPTSAPSGRFAFSSQGDLPWKVSMEEEHLNSTKARQPKDSHPKSCSVRGPSVPGLRNHKGFLQEL